MSFGVIRTLNKRRDDVHRRISELRAELEILEARAEEIEAILKEVLAEESAPNGPPIVSEPKIAIASKTKTNVSDLIVKAMSELADSGYEAADREAIFRIVRRSMPKVKQNTLRVALIRLTKSGRLERTGNIYHLRSGS